MLADDKVKGLIEYWRSSAEEDQDSAKGIFERAERNTSALFFMHLCLEKCMKALYVATKREHAPFTHNLIFLAEKIGLPLDQKKIDQLVAFNEFNTETRYPDERQKLKKLANKEFTKRFLNDLGELKTWILDELKKSPLS